MVSKAFIVTGSMGASAPSATITSLWPQAIASAATPSASAPDAQPVETTPEKPRSG
jgi:hypothetical protein